MVCQREKKQKKQTFSSTRFSKDEDEYSRFKTKTVRQSVVCTKEAATGQGRQCLATLIVVVDVVHIFTSHIFIYMLCDGPAHTCFSSSP